VVFSTPHCDLKEMQPLRRAGLGREVAGTSGNEQETMVKERFDGDGGIRQKLWDGTIRTLEPRLAHNLLAHAPTGTD
jgi:hypothetical protein